MSIFTVSDSGTLAQAFANASSGDTIELLPGTYERDHFLKDRTFDVPLKITSADPDNPAVFGHSLTFVRVDGLEISNVAFDTTTLVEGSNTAPRLMLHTSRNVTIRDVDIAGHIPTEQEGRDPYATDTQRGDPIAGFGYHTGLRIHESASVSVSDTRFSDLKFAVYAGGSTDILLDDMIVENVREGIMFYDVQRMTISDSLFRDLKPWLSYDNPAYELSRHDHPDMIQYWGDNSVIGVHDITITRNVFDAAPGQSGQTIFGHTRSGPDHVTAKNFVVTDNVITNGHLHGISLGDVEGAVIARNVLLPNAPGLEKYWAPLIIAPGGRDLSVYDNTLVRWDRDIWAMDDATRVERGVSLTDNTLLSDTPGDPDYWENWTPPALHPLIAAHREAGLPVIHGTEDGETLWATNDGSALYGHDGNDVLRGGNGADIFTGGAGADRFVFDLRSPPATGDDMIRDLDFAEGDRIHVLTGRAGLFDNDTDPGNPLMLGADRSSAMIDSLADLQEIITSGAMTYTSDGLGGGVLALADGTGFGLVLANVDPEQFSPAFSGSAIQGTEGGETLWATNDGSALYGHGGNDVLRGGNGADIFTGGAGADRFVFDLRSTAATGDDLVLDLDFAEGDRIHVLTNHPGLFDNDTDPGNPLMLGADRSSAMIDSLADLQEIITSGAMTYTSDGLGGGVLALADGTGFGLVLANVDPGDFIF